MKCSERYVYEGDGFCIELLNCDCVEYMGAQGDGSVDVAICDPPYAWKGKYGHKGGRWAKCFGSEFEDWDKPVGDDFFKELFRISKNQIIWGGNYYNLPPCRGFLIWDKKDKIPTLADCEYAWTSFDCNSRVFNSARNPGGISKGKRIHPTQKPIQLYQWIMQRYCLNEGCKVLDPMFGSGSSAIAAYELGLDYVGCEINKEYYDRAVERFKVHVANHPKLGI